jgi:hypothetical protein
MDSGHQSSFLDQSSAQLQRLLQTKLSAMALFSTLSLARSLSVSVIGRCAMQFCAVKLDTSRCVQRRNIQSTCFHQLSYLSSATVLE